MSACYKMAEMMWLRGRDFDASVTAERRNTAAVCSNGMFYHDIDMWVMGFYWRRWTMENMYLEATTTKHGQSEILVSLVTRVSLFIGQCGWSEVLVTNNYGYCNILVTVVANHYGPKRTFSKVEKIQKSKTWTIFANKCSDVIVIWQCIRIVQES